MEGINFNKKFILIILLMTILFSIFFITNVNAANMVLTKNTDFYDTEGVKLGIKLYKGANLYVNDGVKKVNGVSYKMTLLGANNVFIKADALEFDNSTVRNLVTKKATFIYDSAGNMIGEIEKGVKLDTALNEGDEYFEVIIDGLVKVENEENFITKIITFILNLFSNVIVNMVKI